MGVLEGDDDGRRHDGDSDHDDCQIAIRDCHGLRGRIEHPGKEGNEHPRNGEPGDRAKDEAGDRDQRRFGSKERAELRCGCAPAA